jgi:hypothetical protein
MVKHCLIWKPVKCRNVADETVLVRIPETIAAHYQGTLLSRILSMPPQTPISFVAAVNLVSEKQKESFALGRMGRELYHYSWYTENFIQWISNLGHHIELTGEEFESYSLSERVA